MNRTGIRGIDSIEPGSIVVGVDGSEGASSAVDWAADLAHREHRVLTLLYSAPPPAIPYGALAVPVIDAAEVRRGHEEGQAEVLAEAAAAARVGRFGLAVRTVADDLDPRVALEQATERAHLVVVGSRGRGPVSSLVLGSVSAMLVRHAHGPVVVIRPGEPRTHQPVVAAVDGTATARAVVELAYRYAAATSGRVRVVHCFDPLTVPPGEVGTLTDLQVLLAETVAGLAEKFPDVVADLDSDVSRPTVEAVLAAAEESSLLVLGRTVRRDRRQLFPHPVLTAVVERAHGPVAVVPTAVDA